VLKAIRAAEAGDSGSFKAQLSNHSVGGRPRMELVNLKPNCSLVAVTQDSSVAVTAKWRCRAGKIDAVATCGFLISRGKIAAITGEPVPEYHSVVQ
jgi:hypothetical protein